MLIDPKSHIRFNNKQTQSFHNKSILFKQTVVELSVNIIHVIE